MPWLLNSPLNPGDIDDATYDHVLIVRQIHNSKRDRIVLSLEYGTLDGGEWIGGPASPTEDSTYPAAVIISGEDYVNLITTHEPNPGEKTYDAVKRGFYEWLAAQYPSLAGSLV